MKPTVTVREFARLSTCQVTASLDAATITPGDFDWLCKLSASFRSGGAQLLQVDDRQWLRLDNFVGILETPSGTRIEILPKHHDESATPEKSRALLCRMIQAALDLPTREVGKADLSLFDAPLSEWVIRQFLDALDHLVKRGLRFDYLRVEEEQRFLRGQLDLRRQLRQPVGRRHYFQIRHDVFSPDRPENRLLKSALHLVASRTRNARNWQLAHELLGLMAEVPASRHTQADFKTWRRDRLMAHYEPVRPWSELILREKMPLAVSGGWHGISMLFPMEKLFERYVERAVRRTIPSDMRFTPQASSRHLCTHREKDFFLLRPDMLVAGLRGRWVLDTKWKRINGTDASKNYGLSQADFYQLFAYGQTYLQGEGNLVLIYPKTVTFPEPLPPFVFSKSLRLWVLPFDLDTQQLIEPATPVLPCVAIKEPNLLQVFSA